jgi:hypothetical protein
LGETARSEATKDPRRSGWTTRSSDLNIQGPIEDLVMTADPAKPEHCMFHVADNPGRVCGDTETEYDGEHSVWLCARHRCEMGR